VVIEKIIKDDCVSEKKKQKKGQRTKRVGVKYTVKIGVAEPQNRQKQIPRSEKRIQREM
jgi:hypothetical protein